MPLVAGVDSSTQSTKVELRDLDTGALIASGSAGHPATSPPRSEQPPESWWDALVQALAEARSAVGASAQIAAISIAGQQHGLVLTDGDLRPLRPAKLWNDTESAPQAVRLLDALGAGEWAIRTGSVPTAAFTVAKLAWVAEHEPAVLAEAEHVLLPHDWLTARLTRRPTTDRGDASGTGYRSAADDRWLTDLLDLAVGDDGKRGSGWTDLLPEVLGPHQSSGVVSGSVLGLAGRVEVGPGTGDNMAAALGLGLQPGDVAISLGTSGTVFSVAPAPTADPTGAVAGFADATGRYLPLVCTLNCTKVTDTFAGLLGVEREEFDRLAVGAPAGAGGVTLVPYLDGERTPNRPDATGSLVGLRSNVTRAELARAAVEGVVCGLLDGLDALAAAGVAADGRVHLVGGGARSAAFQHVVAALLGREILVPPVAVEWVAAGAAAQAAAVATGAQPDEVATAWDLASAARLIAPPAQVDAGAIRAAYRQAAGGA